MLRTNRMLPLDDSDVLEELQTPQEIPTADLNHYQIYEMRDGEVCLVGEESPTELEDEWN